MNKTLRIIALALFINSPIYSIVQAQDSTNTFRRHEINIGFNNLFQKSAYPATIIYPIYTYDVYGYPYYYYYYDAYKSPLYGVGYRYHFGKSAIRAGFDFMIKNSDSKYERDYGYYSPTRYDRESKALSYKIRVGYEFHEDFKKTQLFFGLDVFIRSDEIKNKSEYFDTDTLVRTYKNTNTYISYGISPMIGIKYHFNDMLSLSIETTFNFYLYESIYNYESTYTDPYYNTYKTTEREKGARFDISPLGLISLNIHL